MKMDAPLCLLKERTGEGAAFAVSSPVFFYEETEKGGTYGRKKS